MQGTPQESEAGSSGEPGRPKAWTLEWAKGGGGGEEGGIISFPLLLASLLVSPSSSSPPLPDPYLPPLPSQGD